MKKYRKHFLSIFLSIFIFFPNLSFAQDAIINNKDSEAVQENNSAKESRKKRYENASPEQKIRMDKRQEFLKKLTTEQRELLKQENERHRQEVKKITGYDPSEI